MFKNIWYKFAEFHKSRLIVNLLDHTKEDYQRNFDAQFLAAKTLSDFVGMIVRFAFVVFVAQYFLIRAPQANGIASYALGLSGVFAVGLMLSLGGRIMVIILMYESRDLHVHPRKWVRAIFLIFALLTTAALYYGMYDLAQSLVAMKKA